MFDRADSTGTQTRAMNKSQKASTKVKRGKQRHTTHTPGTHHTTRHAHGKTRQDLVEAEMEKSRKAVEQKLISLSESNQATAPTRPGKRGSKGTAVGAGSVAGTAGGGGGGGGVRRKHSKRQEVTKPQLIVDEPPHEKPDKVESRIRGGYNVFLESPRRNGLTPRDYAAEAELAALLAAQRSGAIGSNSKLGGRVQEKAGDADTAGVEQTIPANIYGPLGGQPRYKCGECGARFHVRSLLGAHRRTHDDDFKVRFCGRCRRDSNTTLTASNQCKFCDRKFDLVRTLHIHQLTHCKKIPPQLRRKLAYTELAHEKKAPLPSFQRNAHGHHSHHSHRSHRHHNKEERERERELNSLITTHGMKHPLLEQSEELTKTILRSSAQQERWR